MHDTHPVLGVDFGTCFSSAALLADGVVRPVMDPIGQSSSFPSSVYLADNGELVVGTLAERQKLMFPARYRNEFKRNLGEEATIPLGNQHYRPEQLATTVLVALKTEAEKLTRERLAAAVVTVPASYVGHRRRLMRDAAREAGFNEDQITLLHEPVAAAFAPAHGQEFVPGELVLVYDFGGGTFDTALMRMGERDYEVIDQAALDDCGGSDVDRLLYAHIQDAGGAPLAKLLRVDDDADGEAKSRVLRVKLELIDFARDIKHELTQSPVASDFFPAALLPYEIDRKRFGVLAGPIVAKTITCCRDLLDRNGKKLTEIAGILLAGGSSKMPIVAEVLERELDRPLRWTEDPEVAVAIGAAHWHHARQSVARDSEAWTRYEPEWERLDLALRRRDVGAADEQSKAIIRRYAHSDCVDSPKVAERIPLPVMRELHESWARAGQNLRQREWLYFERGVTVFLPGFPFSWRHVRLRTFLEDRLDEAERALASSTISIAMERRADADALLDRFESEVGEAERLAGDELARVLRRQVADLQPETDEVRAWRDSVQSCIVARQFDAARFLLETGPESSTADLEEVPQAIPRRELGIWRSPLDAVVWLETGSARPELLARWEPAPEPPTAALTEVLRAMVEASQVDAALALSFTHSLDSFLGYEGDQTDTVTEQSDGFETRLHAVNDPRLPCLRATADDEGVPLWIARTAGSTPPGRPDDRGPVLWFHLEAIPAKAEGALGFNALTLVELLPDQHRLVSLLRHLGGQVSLAHAIPATTADLRLPPMTTVELSHYASWVLDVLGVKTAGPLADMSVYYTGARADLLLLLLRELLQQAGGRGPELGPGELTDAWRSSNFRAGSLQLLLQPIHEDARARGVLAAALEAGGTPGGDVADVGVAIEMYDGAIPLQAELHETLERLAAVGLLAGPDPKGQFRVPSSGVGRILLQAFDDVAAEIAALV